METSVNPESSTPDSTRPNEEEESADADLDATAFSENEDNLDQLVK